MVSFPRGMPFFQGNLISASVSVLYRSVVHVVAHVQVMQRPLSSPPPLRSLKTVLSHIRSLKCTAVSSTFKHLIFGAPAARSFR